MPDREKIRARARQIWETEGRPEGRELEHWRRATDEINHEASEAPTVRVPLRADADHDAPPARDDAARKPKTGRQPKS